MRALAVLLVCAVLLKPAHADPPIVRHAAGWALLGGGLFLGAVGGVLATYGTWSSSHNSCPHIEMSNHDCVDDGRAYNASGYTLIGAGAASLVAGIIYLAVTYRRDAQPPVALGQNSLIWNF